MSCHIQKYPVKHPLLRNYIQFFWEIRAGHMQLDHKIIPVRNIDLKFNLNDTSHYMSLNGEEQSLEPVYFSGLQDHFRNARLRLKGRVEVLGICFRPYGLYPFMKIPIAEFKNQLLGAGEIGFRTAVTLRERLMQTPDTAARLDVLEKELLLLLDHVHRPPRNFDRIFHALCHCEDQQLVTFCQQQQIGMRKLERLYHKYVGLSPKTFGALSRFQNSMNQVTRKDYTLLSDIAYGNGYYDQMHFIREFKRYTGNTPKGFIRQNNSMLQIGKMQ